MEVTPFAARGGSPRAGDTAGRRARMRALAAAACIAAAAGALALGPVVSGAAADDAVRRCPYTHRGQQRMAELRGGQRRLDGQPCGGDVDRQRHQRSGARQRLGRRDAHGRRGSGASDDHPRLRQGGRRTAVLQRLVGQPRRARDIGDDARRLQRGQAVPAEHIDADHDAFHGRRRRQQQHQGGQRHQLPRRCTAHDRHGRERRAGDDHQRRHRRGQLHAGVSGGGRQHLAERQQRRQLRRRRS